MAKRQRFKNGTWWSFFRPTWQPSKSINCIPRSRISAVNSAKHHPEQYRGHSKVTHHPVALPHAQNLFILLDLLRDSSTFSAYFLPYLNKFILCHWVHGSQGRLPRRSAPGLFSTISSKTLSVLEFRATNHVHAKLSTNLSNV